MTQPTSVAATDFVTFSPAVRAEDVLANYWLRQVTLRLRREVCWRWRQHGGMAVPDTPVTLPPLSDRLMDSLDQSRYWAEKCHFFQQDPTAQYLTAQLAISPPDAAQSPPGTFGWVVKQLQLDDLAAFILALALAVTFDNAMGEVIAACLNDALATQPTLALAQKLWDQPEAVLAIADPAYPLWCYGLLQPVAGGSDRLPWHSPLAVSPLVAQRLLFAEAPLPLALQPLTCSVAPPLLPETARLIALRLANAGSTGLQVVPVWGPVGCRLGDLIRGMAAVTQRPVVQWRGNEDGLGSGERLKSLLPLCWLNGVDLFLPQDGLRLLAASMASEDLGKCPDHAVSLPLQSLPITLFVALSAPGDRGHLPGQPRLPLVEMPALTHGERLQCWQQALGPHAAALTADLPDCARRFRYGPETIEAIAASLKVRPQPPTAANLRAACRAQMDLDVGELAQKVTPRFGAEQLILPPKQQALFLEIYQAMTALTEVHYGWGTATVWNESGLSVLFAGPPGTGKTMAAEVLAARLELPMYRIDLSQVVNKYIGETEKNLKRLFDLADLADILLFFDEADALFGRRTEVKDAHDRYANLEISYLLERMERFKGLAILATNRKKDLDEAFLRRLRYTLDFPLPDVAERKQIWRQVIPSKVDATALNLDFFAKQFPLAGGHIRSIVFNACLQTAGATQADPLSSGASRDGRGALGAIAPASPPQLTMERVVVAVKREYDKLNRTVSPSQFGEYAPLIERMTQP